MRTIVFIICLYLSNFLFNTSAQDPYYFDFSFNKYLLDTNSNVKVDILFRELDKTRYAIRPLCNNCILSTYDYENMGWLSANSLWTELPDLTSELLLKVIMYEGYKTEIWFEIIDKYNSVIYKTPIRTIWSRKLFNTYIVGLNKFILEKSVNLVPNAKID